MKGEDIKRRFDYLFNLRKGGIEGVWDRIEMYCDPLRGGKFYSPQQTELEVPQKEINTWDLTPLYGASVLAASMQSSLTSPALPWFTLGYKNKDLKTDRDANIWIDDCTERMYDELQESNFNVEMASAYLDLVHYGNTGFTLETESDVYWAGLDFFSIPVRGLYFEQDHKGKILKLYKLLQWTATQIIDKWGEDQKAKLDALLQIAREKDKAPQGIDFKYDIVCCIYPRPEIIAKEQANKRKPKKERDPDIPLAPTLRPWGFKYIYRQDGSEIGEEGGYYENPAFLARWERTSGSMWGHGPSAIAIPTIQYLNAWLETEFSAAEKVADPAILSTERGVLSQLDLRPGGNTVVRSIEDVVPFESKANFPVVERRIEDLRKMIGDVYKLNDLQLKDSPQMTAAEVERRWELMNRVLGAVVTRLQTDLLKPIIERAFNIMFRAKRFKPPPQSVLNADPRLEIRFHGPFMRAQRADDVGALERLAGVVATLGQQGFPDAVDMLDPQAFIKRVAERLSVNPEVLRSDQQIQDLQKVRQEAAKQQLAQAKAETEATQASAQKSRAEAAAAAGPQAGTAGNTLLDEAGATSAPNPLRSVG